MANALDFEQSRIIEPAAAPVGEQEAAVVHLREAASPTPSQLQAGLGWIGRSLSFAVLAAAAILVVISVVGSDVPTAHYPF